MWSLIMILKNLWTPISGKRMIPWEINVQGSMYSYSFNYIHSLLNLKYEFYTVRPKKIRQNSLALKLDLGRVNGILMAYIELWQSKFDSKRNFDTLHVSVLYKMTKRYFFEEFWAILYDTLSYSIHFRSIFFRHFVFFWKITS